MKQFIGRASIVALLGLIGATCSLAAVPRSAAAAVPGGTTNSPRNAPRVTRANFVSLEMQTWGGIANIQMQVLIRGNIMSLNEGAVLSGGSSGSGWSRPRPDITESALSNDQLDALLRLLNEIRFPNLAGNYRQPNLNDGLNETIVLKVSDEENRDQTFVVENYGNTAPPGYFRLARYLGRLVQQKFRDLPSSPSRTPTITRSNFERLEMRTSGGFANIQTALTVRPDSVTWTQSRPGMPGALRTATMTANDLDALLRVLNEAQFPRLDGRYQQQNLADGINETVTLSLRGIAQTFVVENYGDRAPQPYYRVTEYLRQLVQRKFSPNQGGPSTPDDTRPGSKNPVRPTREWSGSVVDETLERAAPAYIVNTRALVNLWREWNIAGPAPSVDFSRELIVLMTTRGGQLRLMLSLDDNGNFEVGGLATRDLRPGFRYVIATVSRAGVKTVNGKELFQQ